MFGLLYNFYKYCKAKAERRLTIALLGVDHAGKTTLLNSLLGDIDHETGPTFGFNSSIVSEGKYTIQIFDLGGGKNIRGVWKKYLAEVHAIVYVVDAADTARFEEAKLTLHDVVTSPFLHEKPILVFANKQDLPTAVAPATLVESLSLTSLKHNSYNIFACTAKVASGTAVDHRLREGLRWLTGCVDRDYARLNPRVLREGEEVRAEEARKKKEREERLRRQREERLQLQEQEAKANVEENVLHEGQAVESHGSSLPPGVPGAIESPGKPSLPPIHRQPLPDTQDLTNLAQDQGTPYIPPAAARSGAAAAAYGTHTTFTITPSQPDPQPAQLQGELGPSDAWQCNASSSRQHQQHAAQLDMDSDSGIQRQGSLRPSSSKTPNNRIVPVGQDAAVGVA